LFLAFSSSSFFFVFFLLFDLHTTKKARKKDAFVTGPGIRGGRVGFGYWGEQIRTIRGGQELSTSSESADGTKPMKAASERPKTVVDVSRMPRPIRQNCGL